MRKLLCLLLTLLFLPILPAMAEGAALAIDPLVEAIRPGKAFLLTFTVPEDGLCDLTLTDLTGDFTMPVVSDLTVTTGSNQLWWNGTSGGVSPAEGVYQLVLTMGEQQAVSTAVIGSHAPYLTSIVSAIDAAKMTMTLDFYASVDGLLSVGLWSGGVWSLLENRQVAAGMNRVVWDASDVTASATALTLTLTDATGFSSNEEHVALNPVDFGLNQEIADPEPTATPAPTAGTVLTPEEIQTVATTAEPTAEPAVSFETPIDVEAALDEAEPTPAAAPQSIWDAPIVIDETSAEAAEEALPAITFTPSYGSPYALTEKDEGTYWATPMDITDEVAIWEMLTAPITVYEATYKGQRKIYLEPDADSRVVGVVTGSSQGVRVIENLSNGWSLIECYSSTFHDNSIQAWNMLIQGYVKTSALKTREVTDKYHIVVDKLTQRLYLFGEGRLLTTLLVSTGLSNERQPYNETRSGEFLYISATGGFWSDNMFAPLGMKFNDGDLLHEVPYVQRSNSNSRIYTTTEPFLGQRASHGCIRVQRKLNADGYNMEWIWDHRKDIGRIVVWEDWQGRQVAYPSDDTVLYYNPKGGSYYHKEDHCDSAKAGTDFEAFTYGELDTGDYADLEFCPYCAPALRKAEIDEINDAHAWGGDHDPILTAARQKYLDTLVKKNGLESLAEGELRYYTPAAADD